MPKRTVIDDGALQRILTAQHQVISRTQALEIGIPQSTVNTWCKAGGKWQKLLPGVYLTATGRITAEQRQVAALLYAGPQSVITGPVAMRLHRLRCPGGDAIDVLIPWTAKRQSIGFVRVHRTRRMPAFSRTGPIRFASPARAVADAAHGFTKLDEARAVVAEGVQRQACSIAQISLELTEGVNRDSLHLRTALAEVRDGIRSVAEARFRQRVRNSDLPQPRYNVFLRAADGTDIGEADAWWAGRWSLGRDRLPGISLLSGRLAEDRRQAQPDAQVRHPPPSLRTDPDRQRLARGLWRPQVLHPRRPPATSAADSGLRGSRLAEAEITKRPRRMPGPLTLGPVRWSPPRREAHRGSSRTVFREGDIRCGPGDPSRTGHCL